MIRNGFFSNTHPNRLKWKVTAAFLVMGLCLALPGWLAWQATIVGSTLMRRPVTESGPGAVSLAHIAESEKPPEPSGSSNGGKNAAQSKLLAQSSPERFSVESIKRDLKSDEPIGRTDPFEPLVRSGTDAAIFGPGSEKRDLLQDLQYTGFIGDVQAKDKVAIIHVADPLAGQKTVIKKAGEVFQVEGKRALITAIARDGLRLSLDGRSRWLPLQPYAEAAPSSTSTSSALEVPESPVAASSPPVKPPSTVGRGVNVED